MHAGSLSEIDYVFYPLNAYKFTFYFMVCAYSKWKQVLNNYTSTNYVLSV